MRRALILAAFSALAALLGLAVWGCVGVTHHLVIAIDRLGDAGMSITQTAAKLNGPHGTIAMTDEDVGAAKSLIIHADLVARHEQQSLGAMDAGASEITQNLNATVLDLRKTILTANGTAAAAGDTLRAAQPALGALAATENAATRSLNDLDARIDDPRVGDLLESLRSGVTSANAITADARRVADDATAKYFKPTPWYRKVLPYATTGAKIAAYALPWP
jgi:hypothetical protein